MIQASDVLKKYFKSLNVSKLILEMISNFNHSTFLIFAIFIYRYKIKIANVKLYDSQKTVAVGHHRNSRMTPLTKKSKNYFE